MLYAKLGAVACEGVHLAASNRVGNHFLLVGGRVVVGHSNLIFGAKNFQAFVAKRVECLWRSHLVQIKAVDVELSRSVFNLLNNVLVPYFVKKSVHRFVLFF